MKRKILRAHLCACAAAAITLLPVTGAPLAADGVAKATIVVPDKPTVVEKTAAGELADALCRVTGAKFSVVSESSAPAGARIYVGATAASKALRPDRDWKADEVLVDNAPDGIVLDGHPDRAPIYAVDCYLERELGVRWWTSKAASYPKNPSPELKVTRYSHASPFRFREIYFLDAFDPDFKVRSKINYTSVCRYEFDRNRRIPKEKGGDYSLYFFKGRGSAYHSAFEVLPPAEYFDKHPEWYSFVRGKRQPKQLCCTNREMLDEYIRVTKELLRSSPESNFIQCSQNDDWDPCWCKECSAVKDAEGGAHGANTLRMANAVAEAIEGEFPGVWVDTFAYQYTRKAPKTTKPRSNLLVRLCSVECGFNRPISDPSFELNAKFMKDLGDWEKIAAGNLFIWDYVVNFSSYMMPHPTILNFADNVRTFAKAGAVGLFEQGDATCSAGEFAPLRFYLLAKLAWDPSIDENALIDEFLSGYYGAKAAPLLKEYIVHMHKVAKAGPPMTLFHEKISRWIGPEAFLKGAALMDKAYAAACSEGSQFAERVRREKMSVDHAFIVEWDVWKNWADANKAAWPRPAAKREAVEDWISACRELGIRSYRETTDPAKIETYFSRLLHECDFTGVWEPKKLMGHDFLLGGVFWPGPETNRPDWAMYRLPSLSRTGWFETVGLNDIHWFRPMPEKMRYKNLPYTMEAFYGPANSWHANQIRKGIARMEGRKNSYYHIRITDSWFPWFMKDKYDYDRASYDEFVRTHKNFVSFSVLNESDGCFGIDFSKAKDPVIKAKMIKDFPLCRKPGDKQRRMAKAMERERAMHFGSSDFSSVYAQNCKWGHLLAKYGVRKFQVYEMEMNASSAPWAFGMFHSRGVARQWGVPFLWYTAPLIIGFTRDGKDSNTEWHCVRRANKNPKLNGGGSISLVMRNCFYGFMGGSTGLELENTSYNFFDDRDPANPKPTKYVKAFENIVAFCEKTERGIPYTPVAALTSVWEDFLRFGYNKNGCRDAFAPNAFFFTLMPVFRNDPYRMSDRKNGDQGCLWNSEFGELCDVICPDGGQPAAVFSKVLAPYKWAFLIGGFDDRKDYDFASVEGWTKAGGTLVCSYDAIADGLVNEAMTGISVGKNAVKSSGSLCTVSGEKIEDFGETYTFHSAGAKGARPFLKDDKGTVVAYENAYGKGRVITVMAYQSIPDRFFNVNLPDGEDDWFHKGMMFDVSSGRTQFPIQKYLLRLARDTTMPVRVEGDVQWGVNLVKGKNGPDRWLVWLMNNKGVTKFEGEEAVIDRKFDAKVKIFNKDTGRTAERTVPAGGYLHLYLPCR